MDSILYAPILIPLLTAAVALAAWRSRNAQRLIGVLGSIALLVSSIVLLVATRDAGIIVSHTGGWMSPFGITIVSDLFGALMVVLNGIVGVAVMIYSVFSIPKRHESFGHYPLVLLLLAGCSGAFLTGDIFNLYVWFEVLLMASFVLMTLGGERGQMEGAIKYVTLNLLSSALFLAAIGLVYGLTGTLNMADASVRLVEIDRTSLENLLAILFFIAFGIKAAVFPLFFWLPASYHTPPVAVSALFAGLLTKVGVYALVRVFTLMFQGDPSFTQGLVLVVACLTMVVGVLGAVAQSEMRRILSFHIVSQIGYMLIGLALFTPLAMAGTVFYIGHHIIVKINLFLISGIAAKLGGSFRLKENGGLYAGYPLLGALFLVPALSLTGIPPLSGFWGKFVFVQAGLETEQYVLVAVVLVVSIFTMISMMKIWSEAFWKPHPDKQPGGKRIGGMIWPVIGLAAMTLTIGLYVEPLMSLALDAAEQLLNPDFYIEAVLGDLMTAEEALSAGAEDAGGGA
jgi:multicomponent Na+:H+ antiporter subunit D